MRNDRTRPPRIAIGLVGSASSFDLSHFGSSPWRNLGWILGSLLLIWVAINLAKHWLDRRG